MDEVILTLVKKSKAYICKPNFALGIQTTANFKAIVPYCLQTILSLFTKQNMKQLLLGIFLSLSLPLSAQTNIEELVKEGVQLYDNGDYNKAIEVYKKALELEPKSTLANYELALTYFTTGNYEKAIEHSDIVLKQKSDYIIQAYITKGSALDQLGKTKESIKLFEKAIKLAC